MKVGFLHGVVWVATATVAAAQPKLGIEQAAREILSANCAACHGQTQQMSRLDVRQVDTILKGGKRGPSVIPGHSTDSILYRAVARIGDLQMPPGKTGLSALRMWKRSKQWIDAGAEMACC